MSHLGYRTKPYVLPKCEHLCKHADHDVAAPLSVVTFCTTALVDSTVIQDLPGRVGTDAFLDDCGNIEAPDTLGDPIADYRRHGASDQSRRCKHCNSEEYISELKQMPTGYLNKQQ